MDYEKKYRELIEKIELISHSALTVEQHQIIDTILGELKESEDERIRKAILDYLTKMWGNSQDDVCGVHVEDAIAWLEKQGESIRIKKGKNYLCTKTHKYAGMEWIEGVKYYSPEDYSLVNQGCTCYCPKYSKEEHNNFFKEVEYDGCLEVDKVEPKFKVGDSIKTANEEPLTITEITDNGYWSEDLFICNFDDAAKWELVEQKPADKVEPKCEESKTKIFDAPTPFEDKLYAFVLACEILVDPSKREFILEHSQEILDAAKEQIGKEQSSAWSEEDEKMLVDAYVMLDWYKGNNWWTARRIKDWLKSLKTRYTWKPSDEQMEIIDMLLTNETMDDNVARVLRELKEQLKK